MAVYVFDHWEVNGITYTSIPLNITITANTTVTAFYHSTTPIQAGFPIWVIPVVVLIGVGAVYMVTKKK